MLFCHVKKWVPYVSKYIWLLYVNETFVSSMNFGDLGNRSWRWSNQKFGQLGRFSIQYLLKRTTNARFASRWPHFLKIGGRTKLSMVICRTREINPFFSVLRCSSWSYQDKIHGTPLKMNVQRKRQPNHRTSLAFHIYSYDTPRKRLKWNQRHEMEFCLDLMKH